MTGKGCIFVLVFTAIFWGLMALFGWVSEAFAVMLLIFAGVFAWESSMAVHEQKIFDKSKVKYKDGDNT